MYKIKWTSQAWDSYNAILVYLVDKWSVDIASKLDDEVVALLDKISNNKHLCPPSQKFNGLRKCTVSKYTSLVYVVKGMEIELITFFDNRANHPF